MFIIFDLDDTLANTGHRQHLLFEEYENESERWKTFFEACDKDEPVKEVIELLNSLIIKHRVEIWTGRSAIVFDKTVNWLRKHINYFNISMLRMRRRGDFRSDIEVKSEWVKEIGKPDIVFDDRNKMVKWWREQGVICCQVKESDY